MMVLDHLLVLAFAVVWPVHGLRTYARFREDVRRGVPGARLAAYAGSMLTQWLLAASAVAVWIGQGRDFADLGLRAPTGWAGAASLAVAALLGGALLGQSAFVARTPRTHAQVRQGLAPLAEMLPKGRNDLTGFLALSVTAGICEEVLYRGFLPWYLDGFVGSAGAHALALAAFAAAHGYLGWAGAARAGLAGAAAAGLYLGSGSLAASMLLHAALDVSAGLMAYAVLETKEARPATA
jgi:membrane protease YdiL (CAAX protease family)